MTSPTTLSPESQAFLEAVRHYLSDLPVPDQADLLDQVDQRLRDLDADGAHGAIQDHLGRAAELASDLRAAAGFAARPSPGNSAQTADSIIELLQAVVRHRAVRPVIGYLTSLRPAWWAFRGYLLFAGTLAAISRGGGYGLHILGYYGQALTGGPVHTSPVWLLAPASVIVGSIAVGMVTARCPAPVRLLIALLNLAAVVLLVAYPTWWLAPAFASYAGLVN